MKIFSTTLVAQVTPGDPNEDSLLLKMHLGIPADDRTEAMRTGLDMGQALARSANYLEEDYTISFYIASCEERS